MSNAEQINWDRRYERVYPHIAGTLVRLCNTYGWGTVLEIFTNDMPTHFPPRERAERHKRALRVARQKTRAA